MPCVHLPADVHGRVPQDPAVHRSVQRRLHTALRGARRASASALRGGGRRRLHGVRSLTHSPRSGGLTNPNKEAQMSTKPTVQPEPVVKVIQGGVSEEQVLRVVEPEATAAEIEAGMSG